jgi:hypothetical protein
MSADGYMSGCLGTPFPSGDISGFDSGLANIGTDIAFTTVAL